MSNRNNTGEENENKNKNKYALQRKIRAFQDQQELRRREQSDGMMAMAVFEETEKQRDRYKFMVVFAIICLIATAICIWILYSLKSSGYHQEFDNLVYSAQGLLSPVIIGLSIFAAYRVFREGGSVLSKNRMKTIEMMRGAYANVGRKAMVERNNIEQDIRGQDPRRGYNYDSLGDRVTDDMGGYEQGVAGMNPYEMEMR